MTSSPRRYAMNHGWVWGPSNPYLDKSASLLMTLRGAPAEQFQPLLRSWLGGLTRDDQSGRYGWGGYSVHILAQEEGSADIVFTSGGQDVAESLGDAVEEFHLKVLQSLSSASVTWTELPLDTTAESPLEPPA
ncbi:MAG: hypothetical protein WBX27_00365 [Specibacter sp.]